MAYTFKYDKYQAKLDKTFGEGSYTVVIGSYKDDYVDILCHKHNGSFRKLAHGFTRSVDGCTICSDAAIAARVQNRIESSTAWRPHYRFLKFVKHTEQYVAMCEKHGEFCMYTKNTTQHGYGCPACTKQEKDDELFADYLKRFNDIWQGRYTYTGLLQRVKGGPNYVGVICPEHGYFEQRIDGHLLGIGCRKCAKSGYNSEIPGVFYVYSLEREGVNYIGFGISNTYKERAGVHRRNIKKAKATGKALYLLRFIDGNKPEQMEDYVKHNFQITSSGILGFVREAILATPENIQAFESYIDSLGIPRETLDKS
jgi:hypothetical protein